MHLQRYLDKEKEYCYVHNSRSQLWTQLHLESFDAHEFTFIKWLRTQLWSRLVNVDLGKKLMRHADLLLK